MLTINNLVVSYGGIEALKGINLEVEEGKIVTLVGANGAGKSTTLRTIMGLVNPVSGQVIYKGMDLLKRKLKIWSNTESRWSRKEGGYSPTLP